MRQLKTLSRKDPEFNAHLDGSFSEKEVALPLRSLNVGSDSEEVTFEIVSADEIESPSLVRVIWQMVRPQSLVFSVGPMLAVLFFCLSHGLLVQGAIALGAFVGVVLFHIAVNLFNDYGDHMKGQDRLRPTGGSRAIQKGWVRARAVKKMGWTLLVLAALCGLPAIVLHFAPILIVAGLASLVALEFAFQRFRLKYRGWAEILAFLLTGPLLACGFAWAITGEVSWTVASLGCVFGAIALMYFHSANFENIMTDSQAGVSTWATRTGFDKSKKFFFFTAVLALFASVIYVAVFDRNIRLLPLILAQLLFVVPVTLRVKHLASPLSSGLTGLRSEAVRLCWITTVALIGGFVWIMAGGVQP